MLLEWDLLTHLLFIFVQIDHENNIISVLNGIHSLYRFIINLRVGV